MILGIQVLGILFGIFMIYYAFLNFKRKEFKATEFIIWIVVWILFITAAASPNLFDFFIKGNLGLKRPLDFYIIIGFMFLIALGFHAYSIAKKNKSKIEKLVREIAFKQQEGK